MKQIKSLSGTKIGYSFSGMLLAILIIHILAIEVKAQYPLWMVGNKMINFENPNSALSVQPLPEPNSLAGYPSYYFYNGENPMRTQYCQFDGDGNLSFFIVDGRIYNNNGYLIANTFFSDGTQNWPAIGSQSQIAVTALPGSCTIFFIFYGTQFSINEQSQAQFIVLDLLQPSLLYEDIEVMGGLVNSTVVRETYLQINESYFDTPAISEISNDYQDEFALALNSNSDEFGPLGSSNLKKGELHWEIIESANNGVKYIFCMIQGILVKLKLETNGFTQAASWSVQNVGSGRFPEGEIEATFNSYLNKWEIIMSDAHASTSTSIETNLIVCYLDNSLDFESAVEVTIGAEPLASTKHYGLEISPNGRYAYFSITQAPHFGYVDLNDNSVHNLSFSIPNDEMFNRSRLEKNIYTDGLTSAIYVFGNSNNIGAIVNPDNPNVAYWDASVNLSSSVENLPSYIDYFSSEFLFKNLQNQNYNGAQIQSFLANSGCCLAQANVAGVQGMIITAANDGTWVYGNNPFNNSTVPVRVVSDLVFEAGTITNINNMIIEFDEDADMIMKAGSQVNLSGSTLTSISCTNTMWPGINLLGTTNAAYNIDQNPPINGDQGYLYMNNSTIEHALKAVEVGTNQTNAGGIIRVYNSTFRNNQYGVVFKKFHCINIAGNFLQNKSVFNNCTFITDAHLNHPNLAPVFHAWLTMVDKINFTNCSFMNTTPLSVYNWKERGTGIYAYQASFMVDGNNDPWDGNLGDLDQTTFYKLQYGIKSFGFNNPLAFYTCKQQEFQYCLYGIVNKNTDNVQIYQNNFVLPDADGFSTNASMERGIYLSNSTGFVVEQNQFMGSNDPLVQEDYPNALGIWVDNSGDFSNEIRNNDFDEMKLGTYVTRENQDFVSGVNGTFDPEPLSDQIGLQLFCNTYTNGQTDVYRDQNTTMRWVQGGNQGNGNSNQISGNRFSVPDCSGATSDWVNDPQNQEHILYICHDQPNTIPDCSGSISTDSIFQGTMLMSNSVIGDTTYNENHCNNTFGEIGMLPTPINLESLIFELNNVKEELQTSKNNYLFIVDDNQSQNTINILSEAFPHESQYYRDLLIQRFPLSDEVMRQLIAQASRLSPWHLTEVFLANSALRKEMIAEIERAEILSPFFMAFLYDADAGSSLRTLMELNIMGLATHRDKLLQQIAQAGLTYESDPELETDQLIYLNEYIDEIDQSDAVVMLRSRTSLLASKQDYTGAIAPVLSEPKLANYKGILEMEQAVAGDWNLLDSTQINELWMIYENPTDWSNTMALGILQEIGLAEFEPEPRVPIQYRSLQIGKDKRNEELPLLGVWPNPATSSAWLHYPIEAEKNSTIQVYGPQGRLLNSFQPNSNGLVELSLKNYESGMYVVQLTAFNRVIESIKFTVINQN